LPDHFPIYNAATAAHKYKGLPTLVGEPYFFAQVLVAFPESLAGSNSIKILGNGVKTCGAKIVEGL